uniref:Uncharacterized protein n=1 Tax=Arundo donax TaxID=35708 RepID=A0A0A8Z4S4_ARUDO
MESWWAFRVWDSCVGIMAQAENETSVSFLKKLRGVSSMQS